MLGSQQYGLKYRRNNVAWRILGDFDDKWTSLNPLTFLTLPLPYFLGKADLKGVIILLKCNADGAAIVTFHLTNKEIMDSLFI